MVRRTNWKSGGEREKVMIVRKFGKWDIGFIKYGNEPKTFLMVRGDWYGENPTIYDHYTPYRVGYDYPERIPKSVKEWLFKNARGMFELQRQLNRESGSNYLQQNI